jgi:hypothetical protein
MKLASSSATSRRRRIFGGQMFEKSVPFVLALSIMAISVSRAQEDAARINTQQDIAQGNQNELLQQRAQVPLSDSELGDISLVNRQPVPKMFSLSTNQSFNFTSNAFLVPNGEQSSFFWNGRIDATLVPYSTRDFAPSLTFEQDFFRYTKFSLLDFDSQTLVFDMKYDLNRQDSWFVNLGYLVSRLYSPHDGIGEFYKYGLLNASITNFRQLGRYPVYFSFSLGSNWRHGDPSAFDRITGYLNAAVLYIPIEHVQVTGFIRPEGQFYTNDPVEASRKDFNLNVGSAVSWTPIENVSFGVTATYVGNFSTLGARQYNVFAPSIAVAARIAF